jgi:hypothetical protein
MSTYAFASAAVDDCAGRRVLRIWLLRSATRCRVMVVAATATSNNITRPPTST